MPTPPPPEHARWPKGTSGNPGGRPKKCFTDVLLKRLDKRPELVEGFVTVAIQNALKGDFRFWSAIYERVEGKVASSIEISDKPQVDWAAIDNECDTPPRQAVDPKGAKPVPASRKAGSPVVSRTSGGVPPGPGQGDDR